MIDENASSLEDDYNSIRGGLAASENALRPVSDTTPGFDGLRNREEVDPLMQDYNDIKAEQLKLSSLSAFEKNPEESAKIYSIAKAKNLPADYVERNLAKVSRPNVDNLPPAVSELMRDRQKAGMIHDDLDNLSWWETAAREAGNIGKTAMSGIYSTNAAAFSLLGGTVNQFSELSLAPSRLLGLNTEEELKNSGADIFGPVGKFFIDQANAQRAGAELYFPKESETSINSAVLGGVKSAVMQVPGMVAGIASRNPKVMLGTMTGSVGGDSYLTAKNAGLSESQSLLYAGSHAAVERITEGIPVGRLFKDLGADASFFKTIAMQMATEIPTEQLATIWQDAIDWAVLNPEKTLSEFGAERADAAVDTLISTVVATGLQTGVITGLDRLSRTKEDRQLQAMADKANESKLNARAPDVFAEHVQGVAEANGSPDNVYIDAKEARGLFQTMQKDAAYDLIAAQIDEAEAVGGDIVIPVGEFASKVTTSKNFDALKNSFRLAPDSPTNSQLANQPERIASLMSEASKHVELKTRADQIFQEISKQLINTGRMNADTAKVNAALVPAYVTVAAYNLKVPVDEVYGMMGIKIEGPDGRGSDSALAQKSLSEWDALLHEMDYSENKPTQSKGDATQFLSNAPEGTRFTEESPLLKRIRKSSDQAFNELGGSPEAGRVGKTSLGQFSEYRTQADIIEPDSIHPDGRIEIHVYGKEQDQKGGAYVAEPALTFIVSKDGELSVNGPTGETFNAFKEAGWAQDAAGKNGEVQDGWTALTNKDGKPIPLSQLSPLIADVHARVRAWRGEDKVGLHWSRSTGATGAIFGGRQTSVFFQSKKFDEANRLSNLDLNGASWVRIRENNPALKNATSSDDEVTIYRATIGDSIRPDDFVAVNKKIAQDELTSVKERDGKGKIIEQKVKIKDLLMGNDATEFVYYPLSKIDQTETDAFKKWFGDSKVVDADGKPLVVYHGSNAEFDTFDVAGGNTPGSWFSTDQEPTKPFGKTKSVYLSVKNPGSMQDLASARRQAAVEFDPNNQGQEFNNSVLSYLTGKGFDGIHAKNFKGAGGTEVWMAVDAEQIKSAIGNKGTFDPNDPSILNQNENRGSFDPKTNIIKLTEASDLSSFAHELGHMFLEMEGRLFNHPNATPEMKADGQVILDWLEIESFESLQDYETNPVSREAHEKFARGFEKYLGEGKAPSIELKAVFRRFAAWIKQVYRDLRNLQVELNDEVRGVMDRMLATDEQINRVKNVFDPMFKDAKEAGMTEPEFQAYSAAASPDSAKEVLLAKMVKQLKREYTKWWKDESIVVAEQVRKEVAKQPLYSALDSMVTEENKLNRADIEAHFNGNVPAKLKPLISDTGMSADDMAALHGLSSGSDLIDQINTQPTLKQKVKELTKSEMVKRHGDILTDGTIEEEAAQAVRNPEHAKKLMAELNALTRKTKQPGIDREAIKAYAKETIGKMAYSKIRPAQYRSAEVRAAREAAIAKNKGDFVAAQTAKQQEIINFYLSREATAAKETAEKIRSSQKAIQIRKYSASNIDMDYVNEAKILLSAYDFRKTSPQESALAKANIARVRNWIESQQKDPNTVATFVQAEILGKLISYKEMTLDDLVGLNDTVSSILHAGRGLAEENKVEYRKNIDDGNASIKENRIETYETEIDSSIPWVQVKNMFDEATASLRKLDSLARQADGMNDQGWVWRNTVKPLLDAARQKLIRQGQSSDALKEIFKGFNGAFKSFNDIRTFTTDSGKKIRMSYQARLSMALNMGNGGNLEALKTMKSQPLTDNDLNKITGTLSEADWQLVQNIWNYIDGFWPEIAKLEIKRSGVAPQKVAARSFVNPLGQQMAGGYYPLAGDSAADIKQLEQDVDTQAAAMMNGGAASKSTKHGSTIERVGFGGKKIDFSINVLFNHIDGVIHDITHWQAVKDVDRVLKNEKINSELAISLSNPGVKAMKQRLKEVAAGPQRLEGLGWINRMLRHARMASTYSALGYSVRTAMMNTMGLTTAIAEMSPTQVAKGATEYYSNITEMNALILDKSEYMRDRGLVLNRDIAQIRAHLRGDGAFTKLKENAFWMMTQTDKAITRPIWLAAYRDGEMRFKTEQEAIDHADRMVARTQGSGMDLDLANVETRNELMKTMTVMYTAFSAIYNISTEQIKRYKSGKISGANLALKMAWLTVVPGIITQLITGSDDDEPEEYAWEIAGQGLGMIPIARDAFAYARYGSSFPTPIIRLTTAPLKFVNQVSQGEIDKGLVGAGAELASWLHIPGGAQLTRSFGYLSDMQDGEIEEFSPIDLLITGKE